MISPHNIQWDYRLLEDEGSLRHFSCSQTFKLQTICLAISLVYTKSTQDLRGKTHRLGFLLLKKYEI